MLDFLIANWFKITPILVVLGWLVTYFIQRSTYRKNKKRDVRKSLSDSINKMIDHGINFWIDENHQSCQADQHKIINLHCQARNIIKNNKKCFKDPQIILKKLSDIKNILTDTPREITDFSSIKKPTEFLYKISDSRDIADVIESK